MSIKPQLTERCPTCEGTGGVWSLAVRCTCGACKGRGDIAKPKIRRVLMRLKHWKKRPKNVFSDWLVCRVKNGRERSAQRWIRTCGRKDTETFIPWVEVPGGRGKQIALFPGFVFVRSPSWMSLKFTPGVLSVITMGQEPAYVPLRDMRTLLRACDREGVLRTESETYAVGQDLRAQKGTFKNVWGVYIGDGSKAGRIKLLYQILSRPIEVEYERHEVTSAPIAVDNQKPIASSDWRAGGGARLKPK